MAFRAHNALRRGAIAIAFMAAATPALATTWHLTEPSRYDDCASALLQSGNVQIFSFPKEIEAIACGDETWGCTAAGNIIIDASAPAYLLPWIEMHEAAHLCGWPADHPGGDVVRVTAAMTPPHGHQSLQVAMR